MEGNTDVQGLQALFDTDAQFSNIPLDMIAVKKQVRELFENTDSTLDELAASIRDQGVLQPILLREMGDGYELIAGERRYRAAALVGLTQIPAYIRTMTDEQAADAQLAENIQRLNLTQMETAKKLQADLDRLGSVQAVLEKHHKSESWLSKMLSLLTLPEETKKLITQNVTADLEVITAVKQVEKIDPAEAKKLVEDLAASKGKESARKKVKAVKEKVKPSKAKAKDAATTKASAQGKTPGQTSPVGGNQPAVDPLDDEQGSLELGSELENSLMIRIYDDVVAGKIPGKIVSDLRQPDRLAAEDYLRTFYRLGQKGQDSGRSVIGGFKKGIFEIGTFREMHLSAYMYGLNGTEFFLLNVVGSVQQ